MSKYKYLSFQTFDIYAYKTHNLTCWQKKYKPKHGSGVWVYAGQVVARSPWEASRLARFVDKDGDDQRVAKWFRCYKLRSQPSFEKAV